LKFSNITTTEDTKNILYRLGGEQSADLFPNILARFAICLSLNDKSKPIPKDAEKDGKMFEPDILFGEHIQIYLGLMKNRMKKDAEDENKLNEITRHHLERGVLLLKARVANMGDFYKLVRESRDV
jgi:DNA sulfur modification protein DndE